MLFFCTFVHSLYSYYINFTIFCACLCCWRKKKKSDHVLGLTKNRKRFVSSSFISWVSMFSFLYFSKNSGQITCFTSYNECVVSFNFGYRTTFFFLYLCEMVEICVNCVSYYKNVPLYDKCEVKYVYAVSNYFSWNVSWTCGKSWWRYFFVEIFYSNQITLYHFDYSDFGV